MDTAETIAHRLELARTHLGWTEPRIMAFHEGLRDQREGRTDHARIGRRSLETSPCMDAECTPEELDALGYHDGANAALALERDPIDYSRDELGMMAQVNAWALNSNGDFEIDDASWTATTAYPVETFLAIMSKEAWIEWFLGEDLDAKEDGRYGYADVLIQDIHEPIVHVVYDDGRVHVWDGYHRIAASFLKGETHLPAIEGRPAPGLALKP